MHRIVWLAVLTLCGCAQKPERAIEVPFTITGLARAEDGSWWAGNHGKLTESDPYRPSLVHLSADFKVIGEIPLAERYPGIESVQGVAVDGDTLWFADLAGKALRHLTMTGEPLGTMPLGYTPNGIAISGAAIWINDFNSDRLELRRLSDGVLLRTATVDVGAQRDQLSMCADTLLYSYGPNRKPGRVDVYDGTLHRLRTLRLAGADAIEGIVQVANTLYVANDARYHHGNPAKNRILIYPLDQ